MAKTTEIPTLKNSYQKRARARRNERAKMKRTGRLVAFYDQEDHSVEVQKFYNSSAWRNARNSYIKEHPVCELSLLEHQVKSAENVHHLIKWFEQPSDELRWKLFLDTDNMISLTAYAHQSIHYAPDRLTDAQKDFIRKSKIKLMDKYLAQGLLVENPRDENI